MNEGIAARQLIGLQRCHPLPERFIPSHPSAGDFNDCKLDPEAAPPDLAPKRAGLWLLESYDLKWMEQTTADSQAELDLDGIFEECVERGIKAAHARIVLLLFQHPSLLDPRFKTSAPVVSS